MPKTEGRKGGRGPRQRPHTHDQRFLAGLLDVLSYGGNRSFGETLGASVSMAYLCHCFGDNRNYINPMTTTSSISPQGA